MKCIDNLPMVPRVCIQLGVLVAVSFFVLVGTVMVLVRKDATSQVYRHASVLAHKEALTVSARLNKAAIITRELATGLETLATSNVEKRRLGNDLIVNTLKKYPDIISLWCLFEPNAFDGRDAEFVNSAYGNDAGRYGAGFDTAQAGKIGLTQTKEDELVPGSGDYYLIPKANAKDTLVDPYLYSYREGTPEVFETSFAVPIWRNGKLAGIAGADITLDELTSVVQQIKPYDKGYAAIISNNGTYVAHSNKSLRGKDIGNSSDMKKVKAAIASGRELELNSYDKSIGGTAHIVVVPIKVGDADAQWAVAVYVPMSEALAPVGRLVLICTAISLVALLMVLWGIIAVSKRIASPIQRLCSVADQLADGNVDAAAELMKAS